MTDHEHDDNTVILTDDDGNEHQFTVLDILEVEGNEYAILLPLDDENEEEAIILKIETDEDGEEILVTVDDDEEWDQVAQAWEEMLFEDDLDS